MTWGNRAVLVALMVDDVAARASGVSPLPSVALPLQRVQPLVAQPTSTVAAIKARAVPPPR